MPYLLNHSERLIHIGSSQLVPGVAVNVDNEDMDNERVKELVEDKTLEIVDAPEPVVAERSQQQQPHPNPPQQPPQPPHQPGQPAPPAPPAPPHPPAATKAS